ncbi:hypothetical protein EDD16DRAFT_1517409 [Pisolithus croceorrhizus]|nr:hypothetical protein EDD16DRAFT_1517409 [Pisolithus croceorrhizus]KAI6130102.1 hypothetical protein EV401DRAFT_1884539 [Pisolithus croceorrhizus]
MHTRDLEVERARRCYLQSAPHRYGIAHPKPSGIFSCLGTFCQPKVMWSSQIVDHHPQRSAQDAAGQKSHSSGSNHRADVSGTMALKSQDGRYMKVFNDDGLRFHGQTLDDKAKFTDNCDKSKGWHGKFERAQWKYREYCAGPGGGVDLGVMHLGGNWIKLTISGYQGMGQGPDFCQVSL